MVEQLRARQASWFAQRAAEQDKERVVHQLQNSGLQITPSGSTQSHAMVVRSEDVLDQLTQRITVRLRSELQAELQKTAITSEANDQQARQQMEGSLSQEIESHTCPICYELMVAPQNAPILLFPCGHTFCSVCITSHTQRHRKRLCPCCREVIQSQAPNVSLQQLIASFAAQSRQLGVHPASRTIVVPANSSASVPEGPSSSSLPDADQLTSCRLQSQMTMLTMRCRVLQNELFEGQQEQEAAAKKLVLLEATVQQQKYGEHIAAQRLQAAQAQAADAASKVAASVEEAEALSRAQRDRIARNDLIWRTLGPLQQEMDKISMLLLGVHDAGQTVVNNKEKSS